MIAKKRKNAISIESSRGLPGSRRSEPEKFSKQHWKGGTLLAPVPVVMVSCGLAGVSRPNIITLAWVGTICSEPPILSISVRPERYSHSIICQSGAFVVNLPSVEQLRACDWCGVKSGRDYDKFAACAWHADAASQVQAPLIRESPVNLECRVKQRLPLGSHELFLAEIVAVQVNETLLDKKGKLRLDKAGLTAYCHGEYYSLGKKLGFFGFSVKKPGTKVRR